MKIVRILLLITAIFCVKAIVPAALAETNALTPFVIKNGDIDGYESFNKGLYYRPESLWNYINGGALPYLDYGVGDVVTFSGKIGPDGVEIVSDIYAFADSLGAFGIYSSERYPDYEFIDIGAEGYVGENAICFWKDRYYIKVFSNELSDDAAESIRRIAEEINRRIPQGGGMSKIFDLMPKDNRQPKSESFTAKNVLGQDFLERGFSASYIEDGVEYQFHIIECADTNDAREKLTKYRDFMKEFGKIENKRPDLGDDAHVFTEDWYGLMIFARSGRFIAASVGLKDYERAVSTLNNIIQRLNQ